MQFYLLRNCTFCHRCKYWLHAISLIRNGVRFVMFAGWYDVISKRSVEIFHGVQYIQLNRQGSNESRIAAWDYISSKGICLTI